MITILLATYNGARYLAAQLDSLLEQDRLPDRIVIQDDCSNDETTAILQRYQAAHCRMFEVVANPVNSGSSARNFMSLMTTYRDDYLMLCDQDDVWLPHKIELTYQKMIELEARFGSMTPLLVHTDLTVVDENLNAEAASFRQSTFADYDRTTLRDQIIQNTATGCTIMYNRALADMVNDIPTHMVMHDWWISLVAAAFGQMGHIDDCTILYRQHSSNQIGVTDMRTLRYKLHRLVNPAGVRSDIAKTYPQAEEFRHLFAGRLTPDQTQFLRHYSTIPRLNKLGRLARVIHLGVWKTGFSRNLAYLLFL